MCPPSAGSIAPLNDYAEPILRAALGVILIPHGMQKLFGAFGGMGFAGNAALFDRIGYTPGIFWGTLVGCTELIGGILLVLGLFTRFAAAAVLIFMIAAVHFTSGQGLLLEQWRLGICAADRLLCAVLTDPRRRQLLARPHDRAGIVIPQRTGSGVFAVARATVIVTTIQSAPNPSARA